MNFLPTSIEPGSDLLLKRWKESIDSLTATLGSDIVTTREELFVSLNDAIKLYETNIEGILGQYENIYPLYGPNLTKFQHDLLTVTSNLNLLFSELSSIRKLGIATFNRIAVQKRDIANQLNRVRNKINTLLLYSQSHYLGKQIGESFHSLTAINIDAVRPQLNIDKDSGIVTLPIKEKKPLIIKSVSINEAKSNGRFGSSDTTSNYRYNNLQDLVDGNPNSWVDYELITKDVLVGNSVNLTLVLRLDKEEICNQASISLINLGTITDTKIQSIEGSVDGNEWFDLTTVMPLASYLTETKEDLLKIGSSKTGYTPTLNIYFNPTILNYVRLVLSQNESIEISISDRQRDIAHRYAIAIRDITVYQNVYEPTGSLSTKNYQMVGPVNSILLMAAITDPNSQLFDDEFSVSFNDGDLNKVHVASSSDLSSPEVIHLSSLGLTPNLIDRVKFKLILSRNDETFKTVSLTEEINFLSRAEEFTVSTSISPIVISSGRQPISGSLIIMETPIFRIGKKLPLPIVGSSYWSGTNTWLDLPWKLSPNNVSDQLLFNDVDIYVNGTQWNKVSDVDLVAIDNEAFTLVNDDVHKTTRLKFGNSGGTDPHRQSPTSSGGKALPDNATVELLIKPELISFEYNSNGTYDSILRFPFDGNKYTTTLETQSEPRTSNEEPIPVGSMVFNIKPLLNSNVPLEVRQYNSSGTVIAALSMTVYKNLVSFQDGTTELVDVGDYSIDYINGTIYSKDPCPGDRTTTVQYTYFERSTLLPEDFGVIQKDNKFVGIAIREDKFRSVSITETVGDDRIAISGFGVGVPSMPDYFPDETANYTPTNKIIYLSHGGLIKNTLVVPLNLFGPFTAEEVEFIDGISEFISVAASRGVGTSLKVYDLSTTYKYSVDYKRGTIHLSQPISVGKSISYQYALYRASYNVASYITNYSLLNDTIEIDSSLLTNMSNGHLRIWYKYLPVSKDSQNIAKYYTPLVRDVQIRYV